MNIRSRVALVGATVVTAALALTACSGSPSTGGAGAAEPDFPKGDITLVVPYAAGGPTDIAARALAKGMEAELKTTIIVENKPGASGITGLSEVSTAKPNGYTITFTPGDAFVQSELRPAPYTFDSFEPVRGLMTQPYILVTSKDSGYTAFGDLLKADRLTYSVSGVGTPTHINTAILSDELKLNTTAVPYDGAGPATQAAVGNNVSFAMLDASGVMPFIKTGDLVPLAVVTADGERLDYLADTPSLAELDVNVDDMTLTIYGTAAPAGLDADIAKKLRDAAAAATLSEEFATFAEANYMPMLTDEQEDGWYDSLKATAKTTSAALKKFGIELQ